MNECGITPPLIWFTNSKPSAPAPSLSGSISMWQSPNCPRPPDCFLCRPCPAACRPRAELGDVPYVLAGEQQQLADPLPDVRVGVQHVAVRVHHPLVDA